MKADEDKELCVRRRGGKERMSPVLRTKGSDPSKEEGTGRRTAGEVDPWGWVPRATGLSGKSGSDSQRVPPSSRPDGRLVGEMALGGGG